MVRLVRAKQPGFYNGRRVRPGQVFRLKDGHQLGRWMEEVHVVPATVIESKDPTTLSEMGTNPQAKTFLDLVGAPKGASAAEEDDEVDLGLAEVVEPPAEKPRTVITPKAKR